MKCNIKINQVFFIFNTREISVNKKDLWASTLVGLTCENPILDPLAVQYLENQQYIMVFNNKD